MKYFFWETRRMQSCRYDSERYHLIALRAFKIDMFNFSGIMKNEIERAKEMADAAINSVSVIQEITSILAPIKDFGVRYLFQDDDIIEDELEQDI